MKTDIFLDEDEHPEPLPFDREDGSAELDLRATFSVLFTDPAVRNFTFTALGSIAMIFLIMFQQSSDLGGLLVVIIGMCGILFRWTAAPIFLLFLIAYFACTPTGFPGDTYENRFSIEESRFYVADVMLVMSILVYLTCHYRIIGIVYQAAAFEGPTRRKDETPARRPPALIHRTELAKLVAICTGLVIAGQLIWMLSNSLEVVPAEDFPLKWAESGRTLRLPDANQTPGGMSPGMTRFVVLVGFLFFGTITARLVFGYWRLRAMGAAEGGMILLDGGWSETSRERQRQERWRIWGRKRAEAAAITTEKAKSGSKS